MKSFFSVFVLTLVMSITAYGAESTSVSILGFSGDGTYMAFHVVGSTPIRDEVFILDVPENEFVAEDSPALIDSLDSLEEYGILPGNSGNLAYQYTGPGGTTPEGMEIERIGFSIGTGDKTRSYTVILEPREAAVSAGKCPGLEGSALRPKIFTMTLQGDGREVVLQQDTVLYDSRNCPVGYRINSIYTHAGRIAVFLDSYSVGPQGYNIGKLAVSGSLPGAELMRKGSLRPVWTTSEAPGETIVFSEAPGNTYEPARAGILVNADFDTVNGRAIISGKGHNQDTVGYARLMRVKVNGQMIEVIDWLNHQETKSFLQVLPAGLIRPGLNIVEAFIHFGNAEYDGGHWVSLNLSIGPPMEIEVVE